MILFCADCGEIMRVKKNGVTLRYGYYAGYFRADLYECPKCGKQVITELGTEIFDTEAEVDYDFSRNR